MNKRIRVRCPKCKIYFKSFITKNVIPEKIIKNILRGEEGKDIYNDLMEGRYFICPTCFEIIYAFYHFDSLFISGWNIYPKVKVIIHHYTKPKICK